MVAREGLTCTDGESDPTADQQQLADDRDVCPAKLLVNPVAHKAYTLLTRVPPTASA